MPGRHRGTALAILASAIAISAVLAGTTGRAAADQTGPGRAFGPGRCGPIDPPYVRGANATGGQILPLGPTEVGAAAALMAASFNAETVFWATAPLTPSGQTITVPVDGVTSRVAFVLSTDGSMTVFGFGRDNEAAGDHSLMTAQNNSFTFGIGAGGGDFNIAAGDVRGAYRPVIVAMGDASRLP